MTRTLVEKRSTEAARTSTGTSESTSMSMTISLAARQDLQRAAALGDQFARRELVRTNPYAMMCNAMMRGYLERTCNASGGGGDTGK